MTHEEQKLAELRARMSEKQRKEMAEIVQNEMRRRGLSHDDEAPVSGGRAPNLPDQKVGTLNRDQVGELYSELNDAVKQLRLKKLEQKVADGRKALREASNSGEGLLSKLASMKKSSAKSAPKKMAPQGRQAFTPNYGPGGISGASAAQFESAPIHPSASEDANDFSLSKVILMGGVVSFGLLKMAFVSGLVDSASEKFHSQMANSSAPVAAPAASSTADVAPAASSKVAPSEAPIVLASAETPMADKQILFELDSRRVELEQRKEVLDRREQDLKAQTAALSERLAELRSLTAKLGEARKEKDQKYETRMEQLANVYGAMNPNESAVLIARLEDDTAIELLQRMPEKRMGQVLSFMDRERAVDLTRILTDKTSLR